MSETGKELTFVEHLEELRGRLIRAVCCWVAACLVVYHFVDPILRFLVRPFGQFYFFSPYEAFEAKLLLILWGGLIVASPYILFQLWAFFSAAFNVQAQKYIAVFVWLSSAFFLLGCAFAYWVVLPFSTKFLLSFSSDVLRPMISISRYLNFVTSLVMAFGVIFEFPLVMVFFVQVGIATPEFLIQMRRYAVVAIFVISAILTPPDWVSQLFMAFPLLGLYELSILLAKWVSRRQRKVEFGFGASVRH